MDTKIDVNRWKRKENYLFFRNFINPFYSVTVDIDVTTAYHQAKQNGYRFSQYCMYAALQVINETEALRYRQIDGEVWLFDQIDLNTPIARDDQSFASVILPYKPSFAEFLETAQPLIEKARQGEGDAYSADSRKDTWVISVNPWYRFTSLAFQIPQNAGENMPISIFGKVTEINGKRIMPVAANFHHGFVDGYQVGLFFEKFQNLLNQ